MSEAHKKDKELAAEVRVVVEVDGKPVGFLNLDVDRLWPLINHRKKELQHIEWLDPHRYDAALRASVVRGLTKRVSEKLYKVLGEEIVTAELDVENLALKTEAAAQAFGARTSDIEALAAEAGRPTADFHNFFWEYLLGNREVADIRKAWKAGR